MLRRLALVCWLCGCNQIFQIPDVKQSQDPCGDGLLKCDANATCSNATCTCNAGFTGDGKTCDDVDECAMSPAPCANHATCTNTPGSYSCACDGNFTGDATTYCEPTTWQKITAASNFGCGIGGDGGVYCWGTNEAGFGDGTTYAHLRPTQIGTATDWTDVVARQLRVCGIRSDHSAWCWGWGVDGELGDGMMMTEATPTMVVSDRPGIGWKQIAIGAQNVCGVHTDGTAACWGLNRENGMTRPVPVAVDNNTDWTQIATGRVTCGLRGSGTLWCWGKSQQGDLGLGATTTDQATPAQVGTSTWKEVSVGSFNTVCAIRSDGALFCWGNNSQTDDLEYGNVPMQIGTATDWNQIVAGYEIIIGVRSGGAAYAWGVNTFGEAGIAQLGDIPNPAPISGTITGWSQIDLEGEAPACGISGGHAYCWGGVGDGALGNGQAIDYFSPTKIGTDTWMTIGGGPGMCGVRSDNTLVCWGNNGVTGVGFGNTAPVWSPTQLGTTAWSTVVGGQSIPNASVCGIRTDTTAYCWGDNSYGELGLGNTTTPQLSPAIVNGAGGWTSLSVADHTCGITNTLNLYCWGNNDSGQLGNGTTTSTNAPGTALAGSWLQVTGTQYGQPGSMTCGIQSGGTLWCWGIDQYPATTQHLTPTQVGTASDWAQVSTAGTSNQTGGGPTTCAVKTGGTLWCWGLWLGDGTTNSSTTPVQVGSESDWRSVAVGGEICAVKTGGTLWCWGNSYILGDGSVPTYDLTTLFLHTTNRPTQIGTDTDWSSVMTAGADSSVSCALKQDGSLWCWGSAAAPVPAVVTTPTPL